MKSPSFLSTKKQKIIMKKKKKSRSLVSPHGPPWNPQVKILIELDWSRCLNSQPHNHHTLFHWNSPLNVKGGRSYLCPSFTFSIHKRIFFFFLNENVRVTNFFTICLRDEWLLIIEKKAKMQIPSSKFG